MHDTLRIPDILDIVCKNLCRKHSLDDLTTVPNDTGQSDLCALARTSTLFQNSALNLPWRRQDTILNLLRCMPADLWDITEIEDDEEDEEPGEVRVRLRRTITSEDWERALFYSNRVKIFAAAFPEAADPFEELALSLPGESIFPNLQGLHWHPRPKLFHHVRLFLAPKITHLVFDYLTSFTDLSVLSNLPAKCPSLKEVVLDGFDAEVVSISAVSIFARRLECIESLDVPQVDQTALVHLAQLPNLKDFRLTLPISDLPPPSTGSARFPGLTSLSLPTMKCAIALLPWSATLTLTNLVITGLDDIPTKIAARAFYASLASHCSHLSLTRIIIGGVFDRLDSPESDTYAVGYDVLQPFSAFINLFVVSLEHPVGFDLDDAAVAQLARSWPRLKHLSLKAKPHPHIRSRVTLEGFYALAEHCPSLHTLAMTVDATVVPALRDPRNMQRVAQERLRALHVSLSPVVNISRVAVFLGAIFPELRSIETSYDEWLPGEEDLNPEDRVADEVMELHDRWRAVADALQLNQS